MGRQWVGFTLRQYWPVFYYKCAGDNVIHNRQRYTSVQSYRDSLTPDARSLYDLELLDSERYYDDVRSDRTVYVTVYTRVLRYGGTEEGGWWYDTWHVADDAPGFRSHNVADDVRDNLATANTWCESVNGTLAPYHSVNGGMEYMPIVELSRGSHVNTERQRYS